MQRNALSLRSAGRRVARILAALALVAGALPGAEPQEFPTAAGTLKLTPIEHASLLLEAGGKVLYIDPAQGSYDGKPRADYILITHAHGDHLTPAILAQLKKPATMTVAPETVAATLSGCTVIAAGQTKAAGPFQVEAVPAYNLNRGPRPGQLYHEKGNGVGYILTYGGKRFYFSGDTEGTPEMRSLKNIDVAFVCMNLPYTMTPAEAADAIKAFHPKVIYPYHYRGQDLGVLSQALAGTGIQVRLPGWYGK